MEEIGRLAVLGIRTPGHCSYGVRVRAPMMVPVENAVEDYN